MKKEHGGAVHAAGLGLRHAAVLPGGCVPGKDGGLDVICDRHSLSRLHDGYAPLQDVRTGSVIATRLGTAAKK